MVDVSVPVPTVPTNQTTVEVVRREKNNFSADDDRATRRISYLKATSNDQMNIPVDREPTSTPVQKR